MIYKTFKKYIDLVKMNYFTLHTFSIFVFMLQLKNLNLVVSSTSPSLVGRVPYVSIKHRKPLIFSKTEIKIKSATTFHILYRSTKTAISPSWLNTKRLSLSALAIALSSFGFCNKRNLTFESHPTYHLQKWFLENHSGRSANHDLIN